MRNPKQGTMLRCMVLILDTVEARQLEHDLPRRPAQLFRVYCSCPVDPMVPQYGPLCNILIY